MKESEKVPLQDKAANFCGPASVYSAMKNLTIIAIFVKRIVGYELRP